MQLTQPEPGTGVYDMDGQVVQMPPAVLYCDNGAVAHTTPVYIIVDGKPTWDAKVTPEIIYRHLGAIKMMDDMERSSLFKDTGIVKRLETAREYYNRLLSEINSYKL